jgi:DNA polymerase-3 subunit beta
MTAHDPNAFDPLILDALHIPVERLRQILRQLVPAYERRVTIPVLETTLIEAGPDGTTFQQTDLDLHITVRANDLTCARPFRTCVSHGLLRRFAASFDGVIRLSYVPASVKKGEAQMPRITLATDDGCSATINSLIPAEDFPLRLGGGEADQANHWRPMAFSPAELRRLIDLAAPCISTEATRYYLNGINMQPHPERGTLRAIATDGHRMAVIDGPTPAIEGLNVILPKGFVRAIAHLVNPKANDTAVLSFHSALPRARLTCGPVQIDAKLIDGTFPEYTRVIPKEPARMSLTLSANALRRMRPFALHRSNAVRFENGRMTMRDYTDGEVSAPVTMTVHDGATPDMQKHYENGRTETWGFRLEYLLSQAALTPTFRADLASPSDPARIFGEDPEAMWILMPMRV